jgi:hypothetical protein
MNIGARHNDGGPSRVGGGRLRDEASVPLVIGTILREEGITGVHTHVRQLRQYLEECGTAATLVTPFSLGPGVHVPRFRSPPRIGAMQPIGRRRLVSALA